MIAFQTVPPAPGRQDPASPGEPAQKAPPAGGPEGAPPPPGGGLFGMMFPLLLVGMLLFIFWSNRSQQKKQESAISALKKGDRVVTQGGIIGRLVDLEPKYAKLEIAPGVKVQVLRSSLSGRDVEDATSKKDSTEAAPEKKA